MQVVSTGDLSSHDDIVSRMVERDITVDITQERESEIAQKVADLDKERSDLETDKKRVVSEYNEKIAKKVSEMSDLLEEVRVGESTIFTMVKEVKDYKACSVKYFIGKSFEQLVEERAMENTELQQDMFIRKETTSEEDMEKKGDELMENAKPTDVRDIIREETNGKTKHSAVDGPQ